MLLRTLPIALMLAACGEDPPEDAADDPPVFEGTYQAPPPTLRRLTASQYRHAIRDLVGDVLLTGRLEPDVAVDGLRAVGASTSGISARGVEQYEAAAFEIAEQVVADDALYEAVVGCEPGSPSDRRICATDFAEHFGRLAWRRPLSADEVDRIVDVMLGASDTLGSFDDAVVYGLAVILQSPSFLFREEVGEADGDGRRTYTSWELASRLSFLLWDSVPDDALLDAAASGDLDTDEGLREQVRRMLDDPRAAQGTRAWFDDWYELYHLEDLRKDPSIFTHMSATVGTKAREQTLLDLAYHTLDADADFRKVFTTRATHVDRELASIYGMPSPQRLGFGLTEFPADGPRRGLLGQVSFLAGHAHPTSSSPTLRGIFVREKVLCDPIPPPPANVDTSIPEPNPDAPTLRDRVAAHLESPACRGCHEKTDLVGLGFENFDGLGRFRTLENGAKIDASGEVDGDTFDDAWELAKVIETDARVPACLVDGYFAYATGHVPEPAEGELVEHLVDRFAYDGYRFKALAEALVLSPAFRTVGALDLEDSDE